MGYKRVTAPLFEPGEIDIDILLCSHEHGDHLDIYAMPELLGNPGMACYTNAQSIAELEKNSIDTSRVTAIAIGDSVDMGEFTLRVVDCDHGSSTPGAMGFILDFGFRKIYYSGDTPSVSLVFSSGSAKYRLGFFSQQSAFFSCLLSVSYTHLKVL